jgi:hypothetical protein
MLSTTKDSNESRRSILNFLNSSLQNTLLFTLAIILMIDFRFDDKFSFAVC